MSQPDTRYMNSITMFEFLLMLLSRQGLRTIFLACLLRHVIAVDSSPKCKVSLGSHMAAYPLCSRWCIGCEDIDTSFGHNCYYPSGQCCSPITPEGTFIPDSFACVQDACSASDAQAAFNVWLADCDRKGFPVAESDYPPGYAAGGSGTSE